MALYLRPSSLEVRSLLGLGEGKLDFGERKRIRKGTFDPAIPSFFGLYGYNGSGKSGFISAFRILRAFQKGQSPERKARDFVKAGEKECSILLESLVMEEERPLAFLSYELSFFKEERKGKKGKERLLYRPIEGNRLGRPLVLLPREAFGEGDGSFLGTVAHPYSSLLRNTLRDELLVFPFDEREDTQFLRLLRGGSVSLEEGERCRARLLSSLEAVSHLLAFEIDLEVGEKDGRAILLSSKGEEKIPYLLESAGTRKLLLLLSSLAPYLTRRSAWAILDEVDAGIFEYLFGELMRSLYQRGKGSLLFTSHDLRTLETLPHHHARFASLLAEGRFYEIKAAKGENLRDLYLRSLALRSKYPGEDIPAFMRRASRLGGDE